MKRHTVLNRFYLLVSVVVSMIIPFLTFEIRDEIPVQTPAPMNLPHFEEVKNISIPVKEVIDYTPIIFWSLFGLITLLMLFRFGKNIWKIHIKSKSNQSIQYGGARLVLLKEKILPHTFLNTIFVNEKDYYTMDIEEELFTHELVHVNQKHTLDILFIEFLKTIFWFNPVFFFYKKAIQLNHEFLADQAVVVAYDDVPFYQNLLLQKGIMNETIYLTSNLNYSVTKKRLLMMTKNSSNGLIVLKKTAILPLLAGLISFSCVETVEEEITNSVSSKYYQKNLDEDKRRDSYYAGVRVIVDNQMDGIKFDKVYEELTLTEKRKYLGLPSRFKKKELYQGIYDSYKNPKEYAVWIDGKSVDSKALNNYKPADFAYYTSFYVYKKKRSEKFPQPYQCQLYTNAYFDKNLKDKHLKCDRDTMKIIFYKKGVRVADSVAMKEMAEEISDEQARRLRELKKRNKLSNFSNRERMKGSTDKMARKLGKVRKTI
ncbi:M56 family metallopeptidase [Flavobacterium sp. N1946]|uniref:M56 family metallopeptidase n=1 Tax=Flavobacterium sp. N1946 TaxID=2986826 RepID=UPI002224B25E|nr:M56 family metallopeptidase [Flavobacterium sp. N1946]